MVQLTMDEREVSRNAEKAISLIKEQNTLDALFFLDKIIDETERADVRSAYALSIALERGKIKDAIDLCIQSIEDDPDNPFHYMNLGKIYLKDGKKAVAIDIFRKGLRLREDGNSEREITVILNELGIRKRPLLPFLGRKNFINKYIGLFLHKIGIR